MYKDALLRFRFLILLNRAEHEELCVFKCTHCVVSTAPIIDEFTICSGDSQSQDS